MHFLPNEDKTCADWQRTPSCYMGSLLMEAGWQPEALVGTLAALKIHKAEAPDQLPGGGAASVAASGVPALGSRSHREKPTGV